MMPPDARPSAAVMPSERTVQTDAMLLPAGIWRRVFRVLWVVLALNALVMFGMTQAVTLQFLQNPSQRILTGLAETGLSLTLYSAFFILGTLIFFPVFFLVALLL